MRKRNVHIQLWLSEKEAAALERHARAAGITQSAYLRHLITGFEPRPAPTPDYYAFMRSLYSLGNNLNQIAQKAHMLGAIDAQRYDKYARLAEEAIVKITKEIVEPRKIEKGELYVQNDGRVM